MTSEAVIPLLPCKQLGATLDFYRALDFEVVHEQEEPYLYGAVQMGSLQLHLANLAVYGARNAFGASLLFVDEVATYYRRFASGLRAKYGKVPTAGLPRISRLRHAQTRFKVFDPSGNLLIFIRRDEPKTDYRGPARGGSPLTSALENAIFFRDTYANDDAASHILETALGKNPSAAPIERARALACLAELAVARGEQALAKTTGQALREVRLSSEERERFAEELTAADELARWIVEDER